MHPDTLAPADKGRLAVLCLIYVALMLYSSTVIGPLGVNFVYRDPAEIFRDFLATPYVFHGSDQRADWIGNLMMLVPFGFLLGGLFWPRSAWRMPIAALATLIVAELVILAIKYLQLFFPPRTVTLNYIIAQTAGAAIGWLCYAVWHHRVAVPSRRRDLVATFVLLLRLYTGALMVFTLMPLDFALDAADLSAQWDRLPDTILVLPGGGRPLSVRIVLIAMAMAAFIPVGMLLTFTKRGVYYVGTGLATVTLWGLLLTSALFVTSTLVISAYPTMPSIFYRTLGIIIGCVSIRWLSRRDPKALRSLLRAAVPWLAVPYLLTVLLVNRLLSLDWQTPRQAIDHLYVLGLLPLFDFYIVTKAEAAKNIVGHLVMFAPVGVLAWLRHDKPVGGRAFAIAAGLSLIVEAGRYLRPGLEGDINAVALAGIAALAGARAMPAVWAMVEALCARTPSGSARRWQSRSKGGRAPRVLGEVEEF